MTNLAIFVSGSGTNCENIIKYFQDDSEVNINIVISNRADAFALVRAARLNVKTAVVTRSEWNDAEKILSLIDGADYIILAGFLLMVPPYLTAAYPNRIINIHPALLPKYGGKGMYGMHVHEAVKAAGEQETGITIHYVNNVCDGGEIIFQAKTTISPKDTPDDIAAKVHVLEMEHFPKVIDSIIKASK